MANVNVLQCHEAIITNKNKCNFNYYVERCNLTFHLKQFKIKFFAGKQFNICIRQLKLSNNDNEENVLPKLCYQNKNIGKKSKNNFKCFWEIINRNYSKYYRRFLMIVNRFMV